MTCLYAMFTLIMMNVNRKLSTVFIIVCVLYMCLISVFHFGLQDRDWTIHRHNDLQLKSSGVHDLQHKNSQKMTNGVHEPPVNSSPTKPRNISDTYQSKDSSKNSFLDLSVSSSDNNQSLTMRKLKEKISQHASDLSQSATDLIQPTIDVSHQYTSPGNSSLKMTSVSQRTVDFHFLHGYYIYGMFLDKRYSKGDYIRVLVLRPTLNLTTQLMCQFHNSQNRGVNIKAEPYEMCENHGKKYGGWVYSCLVPQTSEATFETVALLVVNEGWIALDHLESIPIQSLNVLDEHVQRFTHSAYSDDNRKQTSMTNDNRKQEYNTNNNAKHVLMINNTKQTIRTNDNVRHTTVINDNVDQFSMTNAQQTTHLSEMKNMRLGVCVPPLHGDICLSKIINFIEMCQLLGAHKIFLYIQDIPMDILTFLQNYTGLNPNILSLVIWDLPIIKKKTETTETNQIIWNQGQLLAVQHCLYTNMAYFDWLLFIDIDEMLIPQTTNTWPDLLSEIMSHFSPQFHKSIAGISFESAFFQQDFQTLATNSIDYFQYLYRTKETSSRRSKLFVKPPNVFELGIHHLSRAVSKDMSEIKVGSQQALLHHYRKCVPDLNSGSSLNCDVLIKDETILRYEVPMTAASRKVIANSMEFFAQYS